MEELSIFLNTLFIIIAGSAILRMMNHFLTDDVFNAGITDYLNAKKFGNAEQKDLWNALTSVARRNGDFDTDVAVVMDSWTLQTGFPVLNVVRNYDTGVIQFSQVCLLTLLKYSYSSCNAARARFSQSNLF